jgi:hypothetical protein
MRRFPVEAISTTRPRGAAMPSAASNIMPPTVSNTRSAPLPDLRAPACQPDRGFRAGTLPELTWRSAVRTFGDAGAAELSYLIGLYCMVSVTLNTFDVPVPESAE